MKLGSDAVTEKIPSLSVARSAMDRYAEGDDRAFRELYGALFPRLHSYLLRSTRDGAQAADLVQQTMLRIHLARRRFSPGADVVPWAYAIARRVSVDNARRTRRSLPQVSGLQPEGPETADSAVSADDRAHWMDVSRKLETELARLPELQRRAFELVKIEGLSFREVAERSGTTVNAVKLRAHRAYAALRAALRPCGEKQELLARASWSHRPDVTSTTEIAARSI